MPNTALITAQTTKEATKVQARIVPRPASCASSVASSLESTTANSPHMPTTPCTEIAPTGSSILSVSSPMIEKTTSTPPIAPTIVASTGLGASGSAVIATRPASAPFSAMVRSDFPNISRAVISAATTPPAAAILVLTNTSATALASPISDSLSSEPPLKPNQPSQRMKVPSVASGMLAPGIALILTSATYFPLRAPSSNTPASAAAPPHRCTTPDPAKSLKPMLSRNPPPHFQYPCIG